MHVYWKSCVLREEECDTKPCTDLVNVFTLVAVEALTCDNRGDDARRMRFNSTARPRRCLAPRTFHCCSGWVAAYRRLGLTGISPSEQVEAKRQEFQTPASDELYHPRRQE